MTYPLPDAALDDRLGFVGTSGSGKTYAAGTGVERILTHKGRVIIADPLGVWWGLRMAADGDKPSRHEVVIFGGEHGDLPLNEHSGGLIGEAIAGIAQSAIIDLSRLGTKAAGRRFMVAFLTAIYRHASKEPVHLVFDEADMWAPQRLLDKEGEAAKLLGMMETIVRRGRVLGFIPWLITQRPAVLSKDVLSQADGLVVMKLTSSQDRDAIGDWVEGQADKAQWRSIWSELPTFPVGQGLVWIPGRGIFAGASFPAKKTYDSSRAPKRGESRATAALPALDLPVLRQKLAAVEAEAKANDPKELRAEIAKLKREIAQRDAAGPAKPDPAAIEEAHKRGFVAGAIEHKERLAAVFADLESAWKRHLSASADITIAVARIIDAANLDPGYVPEKHSGHRARSDRPSPSPTSPRLRGEVPSRKPPNPPPYPPPQAGEGISRPQRKVLDALAFWRSVGHDSPTRPMTAAVAGYAPSSGGFNNLIGGMRTAGLIEIPSAGRVMLSGGASLVNGAMTAAEAREFMLSILSEPQRRLVDAAIGMAELTRAELSERTGYAANSGGFNNLIGSLCSLAIFEKPRAGSVALSDWAAQILG